MDHHKDIESTLNALLLNAEELQAAGPSTHLSDQQKSLLDTLFHQWDDLSEDEKQALLEAKIETKMVHLAQKNQACLSRVLAQ
jgi:hypothetical protein